VTVENLYRIAPRDFEKTSFDVLHAGDFPFEF